jgi:chromosome segregation ATPase
MLTEINQEIYQLKEKLLIKGKLDSLIRMINDELKNKRNQAIVLKDQLSDEEKDVQKLEGASFSSIMLSLIGKKDEKLYKEREEYLTAKLKYEECIGSIKKLEKELQNAKNDLKRYAGVEEEYDRLIKEKKNLLIKEGGESGRRLNDNLEDINQIKLNIKELREAVVAGERALNALGRMKESLKEAQGWGTWDILGGGLMSNIAKHSAIDRANEDSHEFKNLLKSFEKELSDVNEFTDVEVNISSFETFADFFFDGFFVDWFVQSKINDSLDNVNRAFDKIDSIIVELRRNLNMLEVDLKDKEREIKELLEL